MTAVAEAPAPQAAPPTKSTIRQLLQNNIREYGMLVALLVIVAFFQWRTDGVLLTPLNITNIVLQNSYIVIMALGMLLIIVAGHIDLSVGSVVAIISAIAGYLIVNQGLNWVVAAIICVAVGAVIGAWHGYWVAYQGIPAFIVTLASMLLFRGLTLVVIGESGSIGPFPGGFGKLASGFIGDPFGGDGRHVLTLVLAVVAGAAVLFVDLRSRAAQTKYGFTPSPWYVFAAKNVFMVGSILWLSWTMSGYRGYPNVFIVLAILVVGYTVLSAKSVIGRRVYATGGNAKAAELSGVNARRITAFAFINMGALAGLGGLVYAARLNSAVPKAGDGLELDVIAACFIGGASATGGVGKVSGAVIGAFIMGIMNNGMSIMSIDVGWQRVIKGLVLLVAVWFDVFNKRRGAVGATA